MVKTWEERCEQFDDMHVVSHADINRMMQEEIDDLRADLAAARADGEGAFALAQERLNRALKAEAELVAARALLLAVQREIDAGRGVSEETAFAIDAALAGKGE